MLAYQRNWNAVGVVLAVGTVTAGTDAVVCYREGSRDAAYGHGIMGALTLGLGWWFVGGGF